MDELHDSGVETTAGMLSYPSRKVILVSTKIRSSSSLMEAAWPDVVLQFFRDDKSTLSDLLSSLKSRLGSNKARHVAILSHSEPGRLHLSVGQPISLDTVSSKEIVSFLSGLFSLMEKGGSSSLDFLASSVAQNEAGQELMRRIRAVVKARVRAVATLFDTVHDDEEMVGGEDASSPTAHRRACPGDLYLDRKKLKGWSFSQKQSMTQFERIRVVGKGAFGTAVLYRKKDEGSLVILKEINIMDLKSNERQLAVNEVQVLSMLVHSNIIAYYDHFEEDGKLMIEMEYADGGTLAEYLSHSTKELEEKEILMMFQQMADALCYIHSNNILHRDLKTANVFLMKDGMVKLGDFGIAKIMSASQQRANTVLGTPYYISPEMCEGKPYNDKSDIWALGCVVYEMANRQRTFEGSNLPALVNKIMKGQFAPVKSSYSESFRRLIQDMLQRNPEARPSAQALVNTRLPLLVKKFVSDGEEEDPVLSTRTSLKCALYYLDLKDFTLMPWSLPNRCCVTDVAVSSSHLLAVSSEREVFSWGSNSCGQLGHDDTTTCAIPRLVEHLSGKSIVKVSCSHDYSMFVSDNGLLLTCGSGRFGCLGHGSMNDCHKPRLVENLLQEDVMHVACGPHHVAAVVADGSLYTWGQNCSGELGLGSQSIQLVPVKVPLDSDCVVRHVVCGIDGTMLLTDAGTVYASGSNAYNKLGLDSRVGFLMTVKRLFNPTQAVVEGVWEFTWVRQLSKYHIVDIAMGPMHTALVTEVGSLLTLGSNQAGQLGMGDRKERDMITTVKSLLDENVMLVSCGDLFTTCATEDNRLFFWGSKPLVNCSTSTNGRGNDSDCFLAEDCTSLDKGSRSNSLPAFPIRARSSSESGLSDVPSRGNSVSSAVTASSVNQTPLRRPRAVTSTDSLSSVLSSVSSTGTRAAPSPILSVTHQKMKKRYRKMRVGSDSLPLGIDHSQQDIIAAMTGPLTTASLSLGFQLKDIAPVLSPTEISLMDPKDPSHLLGLSDDVVSAKVTGLVTCLSYVFVHVEVFVPVVSDLTQEKQRRRNRTKRSLSSLKRKLNLLRRVTIRRTVQRQTSVVEETETEEKKEERRGIDDILEGSLEDAGEGFQTRTWLRDELKDAVVAPAPADVESLESHQSEELNHPALADRDLLQPDDRSSSTEVLVPASAILLGVAQPLKRASSTPRPARRSGAIRKPRRVASAGSRGTESSANNSPLLSQSGSPGSKGKEGVFMHSKSAPLIGVNTLETETVQLHNEIQSVREENARHIQLLRDEAGRTEESLKARIQQLEEEKRRVDEQLELLRREQSEKSEFHKGHVGVNCQKCEEQLKEEMKQLRSNMTKQNSVLEKNVGAVKSLQEQLQKMEVEKKEKNSSLSSPRSAVCSVM
eukprot:m.34505 g.34505  ORF g.34505 m.34505 type:complete len:1380 (+) comp31989_c0_seq3:167-4306(+)